MVNLVWVKVKYLGCETFCMVTVEYRSPNGTAVTVEVMDYQMNDSGALALYVEDGTQVLLSPQTEWVVLDE